MCLCVFSFWESKSGKGSRLLKRFRFDGASYSKKYGLNSACKSFCQDCIKMMAPLKKCLPWIKPPCNHLLCPLQSCVIIQILIKRWRFSVFMASCICMSATISFSQIIHLVFYLINNLVGHAGRSFI